MTLALRGNGGCNQLLLRGKRHCGTALKPEKGSPALLLLPSYLPQDRTQASRQDGSAAVELPGAMSQSKGNVRWGHSKEAAVRCGARCLCVCGDEALGCGMWKKSLLAEILV